MTIHARSRACLAAACILGSSLLVWAATGCGGEPAANRTSDLEQTASALSTADYTDGTGNISVRITTCDWVASTLQSNRPTAEAICPVAPGWVLIGGGAEVFHDPATGSATQTALLRASFPNPNPFNGAAANTSWVARSSDDVQTQLPHQLRAYSIGLKLSGMDAATLQANTDVQH